MSSLPSLSHTRVVVSAPVSGEKRNSTESSEPHTPTRNPFLPSAVPPPARTPPCDPASPRASPDRLASRRGKSRLGSRSIRSQIAQLSRDGFWSIGCLFPARLAGGYLGFASPFSEFLRLGLEGGILEGGGERSDRVWGGFGLLERRPCLYGNNPQI